MPPNAKSSSGRLNVQSEISLARDVENTGRRFSALIVRRTAITVKIAYESRSGLLLEQPRLITSPLDQWPA